MKTPTSPYSVACVLMVALLSSAAFGSLVVAAQFDERKVDVAAYTMAQPGDAVNEPEGIAAPARRPALKLRPPPGH